MTVPRYINDAGEIGVLVSPGYGAGWSTWNSEHAEVFLFHKELVEANLRGAPDTEVEGILHKILGPDAHFYVSWDDVGVRYVSPGSRFTVSEYDGFEALEILSPDYGFVA